MMPENLSSDFDDEKQRIITATGYRVEIHWCATALPLTGSYAILGKSLNFSEPAVSFKWDHRSWHIVNIYHDNNEA